MSVQLLEWMARFSIRCFGVDLTFLFEIEIGLELGVLLETVFFLIYLLLLLFIFCVFLKDIDVIILKILKLNFI